MNGDKTHIIISGGGTGGHLFPALAIAEAFGKREPNAEIVFVGAKGRIEEKKVPAAGYPIHLLPISGFARHLTLKNLTFPFKLLRSLLKARRIVKKIQPDAAVGVGGYAAGPLGYVAAKQGVPLLIQEQNSFPGITNRLLAKYASVICVAYPGTERFFPKEKIVKTGNPVRARLLENTMSKEEAKAHLGFSPDKKLILSLGGSGGAASINEGVAQGLESIYKAEVQLLWQTGAYYFADYREYAEKYPQNIIKATAFIEDMALAYKAADLVISRAGAGTVSELCLLKMPTILVPSPHVAEDHQSKNALALVDDNAAILVKDAETKQKLIPEALKYATDENALKTLSENIYKHAEQNSAERIVDELMKLIDKSKNKSF